LISSYTSPGETATDGVSILFQAFAGSLGPRFNGACPLSPGARNGTFTINHR
jgi:hypothetical protein